MQFPIQIAFKLLALAPQMYVKDSGGTNLGYVRQKLLAFKEAVTVYADDTMQRPLYAIAADRVIDFNANYAITNTEGRHLGSVHRAGMRSLWKAHYQITIEGRPAFEVNEASAFVKFIDGLIGEIPLIGMLTGYFFNPTYIITRTGGAAALRMVKHRSFFESLFEITRDTELSAQEQEAVMLGLMMIILLERSRG